MVENNDGKKGRKEEMMNVRRKKMIAANPPPSFPTNPSSPFSFPFRKKERNPK
jgi:hypothetical protein